MNNIFNSSLTPDSHSFSRPTEAVITHIILLLTVLFDQKILKGLVTYTIQAAADATEIIFDTRDLEIEGVVFPNGTPANYRLGPEKPFLGQPLHISITPLTKAVTIRYKTTSRSAALQWLTPEQTAGKLHPFLFTQSQAILARTWLPCQDSPGIRFTYEAIVQVPPGFLPVMSAINPQITNSANEYQFRMAHPIPSYLLALAVGCLEFRALSLTTGVYAEPPKLEAAVHEFAQLPQMLEVAENLYGKYLWDRYDLLVLPSSFPFGGMENPMLTFLTPTIIAGDRSLTSLVAHELAHSWSGNLVTNATWNDFWLNEGFTVYFERRIMEALNGKEYADMLKVLGYQDLMQTFSDIGLNSPDTQLKLNLQNRDPDEGLTDIAYEKGNYFLLALEAAVGRPALDSFISNYFETFAFKAMDTESFLSYLNTTLLKDRTLFPEINPEDWIFKPGLPNKRPNLISTRFIQVANQVKNWRNGHSAASLETSAWSTHEWLYFLKNIAPDLTKETMYVLDKVFNFTTFGNSEILFVWLTQAIKHDYKPAEQVLKDFLNKVGRRKFILPLYQELVKKDNSRAIAWYKIYRPNYHAVTRSSLDALLNY